MQRRNLSAAIGTVLALTGALVIPAGIAHAAPLTAPGAPGIPATWTSGDKEGLGTALSIDPSHVADSKVWYTLGAGKMTEVFYPTVDKPQVQDLQYIVTDGLGYTSAEADDTTQVTKLVDPKSMEYQQIDTAKNGSYRLTTTYITDPSRATVLMSTRFEQLSTGPQLHLYALFNPSVGGNGNDNMATNIGGTEMLAYGEGDAAVLASSIPFTSVSSGYSGTDSDGYRQLTNDHTLKTVFDSTPTPGNVVQTGEIAVGRDTSFTMALSFGSGTTALNDAHVGADASLAAGFSGHESAYNGGWHDWFATLKPAPSSVTGSPQLTAQYNVALMTLRAHEDKTYRGAFVASLSTPFGQAAKGDSSSSGYHAIWARDLYETATALLAAGDADSANRALSYILNVQERADGSIPHNSLVTGKDTPLTGIQNDEIADPAILADQLGRFDFATWSKIKLSADYLVAHGPTTPEERWEEQAGYSPATIAAEIAGLVSAADIATHNGDTTSAKKYLDTADLWQSSIESWTVTHTGTGAASPTHYVRINTNGAPDQASTITDTNGAGPMDARDLVDPSFLELTRLGVKPATDAVVASSVGVVDSVLKVTTDSGPMWKRYNADGYGEHTDGSGFNSDKKGIGRPWPVLSGERGEYELANGHDALPYLQTMANSANSAYMIPEQVWDAPNLGSLVNGKPTTSAAPLAWAEAQYIRLAVSISAGHNVETPAIVASRYANQVNITFRETEPTTWGENVYLVGSSAQLGAWDPAKAIPLSAATYPDWSARVSVAGGVPFTYKYIVKAADGSVLRQSAVIRPSSTPTGGDITYATTWK